MTDVKWITNTNPVVTVELPYHDDESPCRADVELTSLGTPPSRYSPGDEPEWRVIALDVWVPETGVWMNLWADLEGMKGLDPRSDWHKAIADHINDELPTLRAMALQTTY